MHATTPQKATLSISIPPGQRDAFYQALVRLKLLEGDLFLSMSAVIVKTIIHAAAQAPAPDDEHASLTE